MNSNIIAILPHVLAGLNLTGVFFLVPAYMAIRSGQKDRHRWLMIGALLVGVIFLVIYLVYHAVVGHVPFAGEGTVRVVYFSILASHVLMALVTALLVPFVVVQALRGRFEKHVKFARWTLPSWLFVCISGLTVYIMAFYLYT